MLSRPEGSGDTALPIVVAVVLARDPSLLSEGLDALGGQVYGPFEGIVVGGGPDAKSVSDEFEAPWFATIADAVSSLGPEVTYVWFVDQETRARPDALGALVAEAERVDASVAGSKVLSRDEIMHELRGIDADIYSRAIDVLVSRLRQKLQRPGLIRTVRGLGYQLVEQ